MRPSALPALSQPAASVRSTPPSASPLRSAVYESDGPVASFADVTVAKDDSNSNSNTPTTLAEFFSARPDAFASEPGAGSTLAPASLAATCFSESALLGCVADGTQVHLNTHEPFCAIAVGVQGAGKSHTLAVLLEACLIPFPEGDVVSLRAPMTALVLHYDSKVSAVCEATGLGTPSSALGRLLQLPRSLSRDAVTVLVSPTFYRQRLRFYEGSGVAVRPLLLRWASLSADTIKLLMRVKDSDNQLYMASLLDLLRRYQRAGHVPCFPDFVAEVRAACSVKGQEAPLLQRLALLESFVAEGPANAAIAVQGLDVARACAGAGRLVVADLTDPLLSGEEAGSVFAVLVRAFRALPAAHGRLLCLDEAHRYLADGGAASGGGGGGLAAAVVDCARLMRHDGLRLVVSTQSPRSLPPELLELASVALMHRFHSADWFAALRSRLPLDDSRRAAIAQLPTGTALVFAPRCALPRAAASPSDSADAPDEQQQLFRVAVRRRITADWGASRRNCAAAAGSG